MVVYLKISKLKNKLYIYIYIYGFGQAHLMLLTIMSFFFLSKGVTNPFKPIYKCCGSQWGFVFHYFLRVPQLLLNLTNVVDNDGF